MLKNKIKDSYKGFSLISIDWIPDCQSEGIYLRHRKTGLEVFHLLNNDSENLFAFSFRTPLKNSTGAAHILEHSVFCGSEKFPLKEPFTVMMNQSVNTFLNAMTYSDKTVYPASSINRFDYFNLMDVYADAVFFPLLKKEAFLQEAHRLEIDDQGNYSIQGVVYNEMKGSYSSFESAAADVQLRSLFPDTNYSFDSGGDPLVIPEFSYEDFKAFHKRYYTPDNCLVFLYGNIPTEEQLDFLQEKLLLRLENKFPPASLHEKYPFVPKEFTEMEMPKNLLEPIKISEQVPSSGSTGSAVSLNWLCGLTKDIKSYMECAFLAEVLAGHDGAPISKVLIESGLGDGAAPLTGCVNETAYFFISLGLQGVKSENEDKVYKLILDELKRLYSEGISKKAVEAALMSAEFSNRQVIRSGGPYSLVLLDRVLNGWNYGSSPAKMLYYRNALEKIRENINKNGRFTENLIKKYLLENKKCSFVTAFPSSSFLENRKKAEQELIEKLKSKIDLQTVKEENRLLRLYQQHKETKEEIACIPALKLEELSTDIDIIETKITLCGTSSAKIPLFMNTENTNGIAYFEVYIPVDILSCEEYPYLTLYSYCSLNNGWNGKNWTECAEEEAVCTGGMSVRLCSYSCADTPEALKLKQEFEKYNCVGRDWIVFSVRMLSEKIEDAFNLFTEAFTYFEFNDTERLKKLIEEINSAIRSSVIPRGNRCASIRAQSTKSHTLCTEEIWKGITQLFTMENILKDDIENIAAHFKRIKKLLSNAGAVLHVTADANTMEKVIPEIEKFAEKTSLKPPSPEKKIDKEALKKLLILSSEQKEIPKNEVFTVSSQVGFASSCLPGSFFGTKENACDLVFSHWLSGSFLWERIRTINGAYGAYTSCSNLSGLFVFSTFRDPSPQKSLEDFNKCIEDAAKTLISEDECLRFITGTYGQEVQPSSPAGRGNLGFKRCLCCISDNDRKQKLISILSTTPEDLQEAAARFVNTQEKRSVIICDASSKTDGTIIKLPL